MRVSPGRESRHAVGEKRSRSRRTRTRTALTAPRVVRKTGASRSRCRRGRNGPDRRRKRGPMSAFNGDRQGPRLLRFSCRWQFRSRSASSLFAGAVLLFVSFIFVALLGKGAYDAHRFASEGRFATATVTKKVVHPASDNGTTNTSYEVNYVFTTADGHKVESSDTVDPDTWDQIVDGGPVDVEYAASDPTINRIGIATGVTVIGSILLIVASVLGLLGATFAVKGLLALQTSPESAGPGASDIHAVPRRGRVAVEQPPLLQVPVSPWIAVGSILLFCGVIFLLVGVLALHQERLFHAEGMTATAIVLTKSSHVVYNQQNNSHETKYEVGY